MFKKNLFTLLTQFLIVILPFYVILAVFFSVEIWIEKAGFYIKELVLMLLILSLGYEFIKNKKLPKLELLDYLIIAYIFYWVWITLYNWLWLNSIIYWWRYDFIFFIVLLIFKHWRQFIQVSHRSLVKLFLMSWSLSLLFSILIKFRLWEQALLELWFTDYKSSWTYTWSIPNYHWLENSWIKRFQWILDWPNAMAFFLIVYTSMFLHFIKKKLQYHIILSLVFLFSLLIITYSRSALLWVFTGAGLLFLLNIKYLYNTYFKAKYRKYIIMWLTSFTLIILGFWFIFQDKLENIILRTSSTTWHFDRMEIWIDRFKSKPMWAWLAEAWPAFRSIYPDKQTKEAEQYYIPESWFIQQLIEWWYVYFSLFILILIIILVKLHKKSKPLFMWLVAILVMNVFLHIFEATYLSILFFLFVWLIVSPLPKWKKLA